ncbi:MAG: hypothetical protein ABSA47_18915, partial [Verrucomicrobiota bacterium]
MKQAVQMAPAATEFLRHLANRQRQKLGLGQFLQHPHHVIFDSHEPGPVASRALEFRRQHRGGDSEHLAAVNHVAFRRRHRDQPMAFLSQRTGSRVELGAFEVFGGALQQGHFVNCEKWIKVVNTHREAPKNQIIP